jgi:hypothetical protein
MLTIATDNRSLTEKIAIAAPCKVSWETMIGDEQKRLCGGCSKNVYNLSTMSQAEAESFLQKVDELPCLKFYRRQDGTIIFENCPKGLRKLRDAAKFSWKSASLVLAFCVSSINAFAEQKSDEAPPSNFNLIWTLSEGGPIERAPLQIRKQNSTPLAQLGVPDRYAFYENLYDGDQTKGLGADWAGSEAFSEALELTRQKKFHAAQSAFDTALIATSKPGFDPMYREFIGSEYAKMLTRIGKKKKAKEITAKTKAATFFADKLSQQQ